MELALILLQDFRFDIFSSINWDRTMTKMSVVNDLSYNKTRFSMFSLEVLYHSETLFLQYTSTKANQFSTTLVSKFCFMHFQMKIHTH